MKPSNRTRHPLHDLLNVLAAYYAYPVSVSEHGAKFPAMLEDELCEIIEQRMPDGYSVIYDADGIHVDPED